MDINYKNYKIVCEMIWGCVPSDIEWAKGTNLFKETYNKIFNNA